MFYVNFLDVVFDWDFVFEFLVNVVILMIYLFWLCEEIIMWCFYEFGYLELFD